MGPLLPQAFFARDALVVARELLGKELCRDGVRLRITEVEAYRHPGDTANHCRFGRTQRNAPMWGAPGHAYVYLCYGIHQMLNLVTDQEGEGAAVLIRSCDAVAGHDLIHARRGGKAGPDWLAGPGKVGAALGLDTSWSGHPLYVAGGLEVREGETSPDDASVLIGPRVGIDYALPEHREAPWRFALAESLSITHPSRLRPMQTSRA